MDTKLNKIQNLRHQLFYKIYKASMNKWFTFKKRIIIEDIVLIPSEVKAINISVKLFVKMVDHFAMNDKLVVNEMMLNVYSIQEAPTTE